jgi:hypothetical protein
MVGVGMRNHHRTFHRGAQIQADLQVGKVEALVEWMDLQSQC